MSKVKIEGNASGTGTFTIAAPNSSTDRSITLPDAAGELLLANGDGSNLTGITSYSDSDALDLFNATGSAPVYACRAWVNFNGTGTVAIRASGNVSSITDNNTGDYTVNFTNAMPDANYSMVPHRYWGVNDDGKDALIMAQSDQMTASTCRLLILNPGVAYYDSATITAAFFR